MTEQEMRNQVRDYSTSELKDLCNDVLGKLPQIIMSSDDGGETIIAMLKVMVDELKDRNIDTSFVGDAV